MVEAAARADRNIPRIRDEPLIMVSTLPVSAMARVQQTTENQRRALDEAAERAAWQVVEIYSDEIRGTKDRKRPSPSQARSQSRQRCSKIPNFALK